MPPHFRTEASAHFKTATVITLDLTLACALDGQRLAEPHLAPTLAGRMRHYRIWT